MSSGSRELYEFSNFRLNVAERSLLRGEERLAVPEKVFETLCALVRHGGELVTKDDLMEEVWGDTIVEENNLDKKISALRKILGERGGDKFIETVRGHGFRFVAEVRKVNDFGFGISDLGFQTGNRNGDERPTTNDELSTKNQKPKIKDQIENPKSQIRNPKSNVVALAAWRHETEDAVSEEAETEKATNIETQIVSPAPETTEPERVASTEPLHLAPTESKFQNNRFNFALAALVASVALVGVGYGLFRYFNRPPIEFRADKITSFTTTGKITIAAVSPDGKYLANVQENGEQQSLWVRQVAAENNVQILPPAETKFRGLNFSPDGNRIFYIVGSTLFQIAALGGAPKKVLENVNSSGIGFSPDGKQFAFVRYSKEDSAIFIADADGANERQLYSLACPESLTANPAWSPDGKVIACSVQRAPADRYVLVVQTADGAAAPINSQHATHIRQLAWLPDSKGLIMLGVAENKKSVLKRIYQISYPGGEMRRINNDFTAYDNFSLTADGHSLLAVREQSINHIWTAPGDGDASRAKQLTVGLDKYDGVAGLAWMPDGRILYESKPGGRAETLLMNADGSNPKQVLENGFYTTVSPDGRFLFYQKAGDNGEFGLFRLDLSDNTEKRLTVGHVSWITISPDGKQVIFTRNGEQMGLYRVSIDGGEPTKIFNGAAMAADVSPDGKQIAFHLNKGKESAIFIMPFDGGEATRIFEADFLRVADFPLTALQWTPDGRALNYVVTRDNVSNIWRQPTGGSPTQVTNFTTNLIFNFAYSPDGSQLAMSRGTFNSDVVLIENAK